VKDKKLLAGGAAVLGLAAFWFVLKPQFLDSPPPVVYTDEQIAEAPRPTLTLPEVVLNLLAPPNAPAYVKVQLALEFEDPDHAYVGLGAEAVAHKNEELTVEMEPELHRIKDIVNTVIGARTVDQVATPAGREELKAALHEALGEALHGHHIENVFFVTFITQ
jgi:flagellar basal body-associated protein FliL